MLGEQGVGSGTVLSFGDLDSGSGTTSDKA